MPRVASAREHDGTTDTHVQRMAGLSSQDGNVLHTFGIARVDDRVAVLHVLDDTADQALGPLGRIVHGHELVGAEGCHWGEHDIG